MGQATLRALKVSRCLGGRFVGFARREGGKVAVGDGKKIGVDQE